MSTNREQLIDLSTGIEAAELRLAEVRSWLKTSGWGEPTTREDFLHPGEPTLGLGPRALARHRGLAPATTFVVAGGKVWTADGPTGPARCPLCGLELSDFTDLEEWYATGVEPATRCSGCGHQALLGDWDVESAAVLGVIAIIIEPCDLSWTLGTSAVASVDPRAVAKDLLGELSGALGGRWAYIHLRV